MDLITNRIGVTPLIGKRAVWIRPLRPNVLVGPEQGKKYLLVDSPHRTFLVRTSTIGLWV
jgi:hypothetical protein